MKDPEPSTRLSSVRTCAGVPLPPTFDKLPLLSRATIATRIAAGELLVIHAPLVYRVPKAWLNLHPGGDLSILHFVGRDASSEIEIYHSGRTVAERMGRWVCGRVEVDAAGWRDMVPPVQLGLWPVPVPTITVSLVDVDGHAQPTRLSSPALDGCKVLTPELVDPPFAPLDELPLTPAYQQHLRESHRQLHARISEMGLDKPPPFLSGYGPSILIYLSLLALFVYLYRTATSFLGYFAAAVVLGAFWHQVTFVAHDTGHTGITGDWFTDRLIGLLLAGPIGGLSISWWCHNHNVHHLVTNSPEHDPDIQHLPFFAISNKFFGSLKSSYYRRTMDFDRFAQYMLPFQHKLYYLIMCFARFNLMALSYTHLVTHIPARQSPLFKLHLAEFVGIAVFWTWFSLLIRAIPGVGTRVMFVLVSFAVTSPLHVQIVLSHFSQPVSVTSDMVPHTELLESCLHRQLRTTMDISCPPYLDFLHGGLNSQTPHHLFPRCPRFRFRAVTKVLVEWVKDEQALVRDGTWKGEKLKPNEGLVYKKMEFVAANRDVLGVLQDVGDQVRVLVKVAQADARGELHHTH